MKTPADFVKKAIFFFDDIENDFFLLLKTLHINSLWPYVPSVVCLRNLQ